MVAKIYGLSDDQDKKSMVQESTLSKEIKVLAEVEKIWIIFNVVAKGRVSRLEIFDYLT